MSDENQDNENSSNPRINPPKLDESGNPTQAAISGAKHAFSIAKHLFENAKRVRLPTLAEVMSNYNARNPFDQDKMRAGGLEWCNNFSTNFLGSIADRVKPQIGKQIDKLKTITSSYLPDEIEDGARKTQVFRDGITNLIRGWTAWTDFMSLLRQEVILTGIATPGWLDDDWRPRMFKYDESFLPDGSGQHASGLQVWVTAQSMILHDFVDLIRGKGAEDAGYNIEECIAAVNEIKSPQKRKDTDESPTKNEDAIREGKPIAYTHDEALTIDLWNIVAREYDGKIHLWTVTQNNGREIRHVEDLHEKMEYAVVLFTFQTGNGKFYGSKGLGRYLSNIHVAIERHRCRGADWVHLASMLVLTGDARNMNAPRVRYPFVIIDKEHELANEQFKFDPVAWEIIENKLVALANSIAGAFIPPDIEMQAATPKTTVDAVQQAQREMAVKEGVESRFLAQCYELISVMQRKICSEDNLVEAWRIFEEKVKKQQRGIRVIARKIWELIKSIIPKGSQMEPEPETRIADAEAVSALVVMMEEGLSPEEIAILATSPAAGRQADQVEQVDTMTVQFINEERALGNPMLDQKSATEMKGEIMIGRDRTSRLLLPQDDPNVDAIARRQQRIELGEMQDGVPMPVASSDNHRIHREEINDAFAPILQLLGQAIDSQNPVESLVASSEITVQHYQDHLDQDREATPEQRAQEQAAIDQWIKLTTSARQILDQNAAAAQSNVVPMPGVAAPGGAPASPAGAAGSTPQAAGEGGPVQDLQAASEIAIRAHEAQLREGDQKLKAAELEHRRDVDQIKMLTETAKLATSETLKAQQQGSIEAQAEEEARLREQELVTRQSIGGQPS